MNGQGHLDAAEQLLREADQLEEQKTDSYYVTLKVTKAQVHATLALAEFTGELMT